MGQLRRSIGFRREGGDPVSGSSLWSEATVDESRYTIEIASVPAAPTLSRALTICWEVCVKSTLWMSASLASLIPFVQVACGACIDWRPFWAGFFESLIAYTLDHLRDMRKSTASTVRPKPSSLIRMHLLKTLSVVGLFGFI